jgi:hypothetical protein
VVILPWLLRPPLEWIGLINDFSGVERVVSEKSATDAPRLDGVVGFNFLIPISYLNSP